MVLTITKMSFIKKVTEFEKDFLLELVNKYKGIIENKEFKLSEEKSIVWEKITREFNEELSCSTKTSAQLRKCYANMKARAKKSCLESLYKSTNNGKPPEMLRREYAKIMQMLPEHFADITDSIENEEGLSRLKADVAMSASYYAPPETNAVSCHDDHMEDETSDQNLVPVSLNAMHMLHPPVGVPNSDHLTKTNEPNILTVAVPVTADTVHLLDPPVGVSNSDQVARKTNDIEVVGASSIHLLHPQVSVSPNRDLVGTKVDNLHSVPASSLRHLLNPPVDVSNQTPSSKRDHVGTRMDSPHPVSASSLRQLLNPPVDASNHIPSSNRDHTVTKTTVWMPTTSNQVSHPRQNVDSPKIDRELIVIKQEEEEDGIMATSSTATSNSVSTSPHVVSILEALPRPHQSTQVKDVIGDFQRTNELNEHTHKIKIQLLEDKIMYQAEEHRKKIEMLNNQITHAEQEHQLRMHYLHLKLEKLKKNGHA